MLLTEFGEKLNPTTVPAQSTTGLLVAGTSLVRNHAIELSAPQDGRQSSYVINMTVEGRCRIFDGDDAFFCTPGDLLLFPPEVHQRYVPEPDSPDWRHRWVSFRPRAYWANWLKWRRQTNKIGRLHLSTPELVTEFDGIFRQIEENLRAPQRFSENLALNLLERLLIRCYQESPENLLPPVDPRIEKACQYLLTNLAREVALDDIASHVCLSPSRLGHLFRAEMGVNIVRWLEDQRVTLAKDLLQNSYTPIAKVASQIGYEDPMYFSRVFRKRVGMTPSEYRRVAAARTAPSADTEEWLVIAGSQAG